MKETKSFGAWDVALAADMVKSEEGFRGKAYLCQAGVATIGYGHTKGVHMGDWVSEGEAEALLLADLRGFQAQIKNAVKVPVTRGQFIALMDFTYNLGAANFLSSTLLKLINNGCPHEAAKQFAYWVYITKNGVKQVSKGLANRRAREAKIFIEE